MPRKKITKRAKRGHLTVAASVSIPANIHNAAVEKARVENRNFSQHVSRLLELDLAHAGRLQSAGDVVDAMGRNSADLLREAGAREGGTDASRSRRNDAGSAGKTP